MAQLFPPAANALARGTIYGGVVLLLAAAWALSVWVRSSYVTQVDVNRDQPVPFSHDHHVSGLGIDCRYCHATVETAAFAGMPTTETCLGCHAIIWRDSPLLAPVRDSWRTRQPLAWTRVYDVADFVFFNHGVHLAKGIACESCHGRVDKMPLMRKAVSLHMEWCLDCHWHPERYVRPRSGLYTFGYADSAGSRERTETVTPPTGKAEPPAHSPQIAGPHVAAPPAGPVGARLVKEYGIVVPQLDDCAVCHR